MNKKNFGCGKNFKRELLKEKGWKCNGRKGSDEKWRRPAKVGIEATEWLTITQAATIAWNE